MTWESQTRDKKQSLSKTFLQPYYLCWCWKDELRAFDSYKSFNFFFFFLYITKVLKQKLNLVDAYLGLAFYYHYFLKLLGFPGISLPNPWGFLGFMIFNAF